MDDAGIEHIPVLADILVRQISLPKDAVVVDATIGHGGHSYLLGKMLGKQGRLIGFDVDPKSLEKAKIALGGLECKVELVRTNFSQIALRLKELGIEKVDFILADFGFCSAQLNDPQRGMSFQQNMPLDMRLDSRLELTAADIVNKTDQDELADLIYLYGQERASRRIARFIVEHRAIAPIKTTGQLSAIICKSLGLAAQGRRGKTHPATKTFQALRIAVNKELDVIETLLDVAPDILNHNGILALISFHSLEDKIVKDNFKKNKLDNIYEVLTKKPLVASQEERKFNPRSRSAKLRMAKRI